MCIRDREYVKENLMSVSDKLKGENMYTMAVFAQAEIRLFRNFQADVYKRQGSGCSGGGLWDKASYRHESGAVETDQ